MESTGLHGCTYDDSCCLVGCQESLIDCQSHVEEQLAVFVTGARRVITKGGFLSVEEVIRNWDENGSVLLLHREFSSI
jgi:hypothetical protein